MLQQLHVDSLDQLINETVPPNIQLTAPLEIGDPMSEYQIPATCTATYVAQSTLEIVYWYGLLWNHCACCYTTQYIRKSGLVHPIYTLSSREIAQGRLEALLCSTVICDLTNMPVANASLLDEATAAAEAMQMLHRTQNKNPRVAQNNCFLVANNCLPATIDVLKTRAEPLGIEVKVRHFSQFNFADDGVFACLLQYPAQDEASYTTTNN